MHTWYPISLEQGHLSCNRMPTELFISQLLYGLMRVYNFNI